MARREENMRSPWGHPDKPHEDHRLGSDLVTDAENSAGGDGKLLREVGSVLAAQTRKTSHHADHSAMYFLEQDEEEAEYCECEDGDADDENNNSDDEHEKNRTMPKKADNYAGQIGFSASSGQVSGGFKRSADSSQGVQHPLSVTSEPLSVSSYPRPIPVSGGVTVCWQRSECRVCGSHLAMRYRGQGLAASYPAAFSTRWIHMAARRHFEGDRTLQATGDSDPDLDQRAGDHGSITQATDQGQQLMPPVDASNRNSTQELEVPFQGRQRSFSENDVQILLMKEVGKQLRKCSDEFFLYRTGNRMSVQIPLSESPSEDDSNLEVLTG